MQYMSEFCIAAVMGTVVLFALYFLKRNYDTPHNRLFFGMVVVNLLASAINIVSINTIEHPEQFTPFMRDLVNLSYLWLYNLIAGIFLLYADNLTKIPQAKTPVRVFFWSVHLLETFLIFTSPVTNLIAYFDENLVYCRGLLHPLLYAIAYTEILAGLILYAVNRKRFNHYQKVSVFWYAVANYTAHVFQLIYPRFVIGNFMTTLSLFFLFVAFENHAYYLFQTTMCYNRYAFTTTIRRLQKRRTPYQIMALHMDYIRTSAVASRPSIIDQLTIILGERVDRAFPGKVYVLSNECFAIIEEEASPEWEQSARDRVQECFAEPFVITRQDKTETTRISPMIGTISVTERFPDGYSLLDYLTETVNVSTAALSDEVVDMALEKMRREQKMVHLIDKALEDRAFKVFYQPIMDVESGTYRSAEALIRLRDDNGSFINPEELIRVAEKNGRIDAVGLYVFEEVCRMIRDREIRDLGVHCIQVNLSPRQLRNPALADDLLELIRMYGLSADSFNLEITETAEITQKEKERMVAFMERLREAGVAFSLDDYGSGFATIGTLLTYPVDLVKFDQDILWKAMTEPSAMTLLKTSLSAVRGIGKKAVVEGVETKEMEQMLRQNDCDYLQGFLFSRPLAEENFIRFIREHNRREE
ncbi:MAG: EAL domain-containing protein [Clostridia bacterium]|nr:EAL domain-containing protein [Clostridia bacterium]